MNKHEDLDVTESATEYKQFLKHLPNTIDSISSLAEDVEVFGEEVGWDMAIVMQVNLVLEELIVNVIDYGFPDGRSGIIDVLIQANNKEINIHITDNGDAFDPFQNESPDVSLDIEDRPIGGLGIYLVRSYMHDYDYSYAQNHNIVKLSKKLTVEE